MINLETVEGQVEKVGIDPFKKTLDETYAHDRMVSNQQWAEIKSLLERIANQSERQREKAPPEVVELSNISGTQQPRTYTTKTSLRVSWLLITSNPTTDNIALNVGLRRWNFFNSGTFYFPIEIPQGIDLFATDVTTPASVTFAIYVIGYPA